MQLNAFKIFDSDCHVTGVDNRLLLINLEWSDIGFVNSRQSECPVTFASRWTVDSLRLRFMPEGIHFNFLYSSDTLLTYMPTCSQYSLSIKHRLFQRGTFVIFVIISDSVILVSLPNLPITVRLTVLLWVTIHCVSKKGPRHYRL